MASPSVTRPLRRPKVTKKSDPSIAAMQTPTQEKKTTQTSLKRWFTPTSADKDDHSAKKARVAEPIEEPRPQRKPTITYSRKTSVSDGQEREQLFTRAAVKQKTQSPEKPVQKESVSRNKVSNGLKHELERLQPAAADTVVKKNEKRKLRSQEGAKHKSELSNYFPEYDVVIGNEVADRRTSDPFSLAESSLC